MLNIKIQKNSKTWIELEKNKEASDMKEKSELLDKTLKNLIDNVEINTIEDIQKLISIKYSKCTDIDITRCMSGNKPTSDIICELVRYRDIKKLPNNFLDNVEYKKNLHTQEAGKWWGSVEKSVEINSIIKNITSKLYIQAKNLKLNLSEYFINIYYLYCKNPIRKIHQHYLHLIKHILRII